MMDGQEYLSSARRIASSEGLAEWPALVRIFLPRLRAISWPPELQQALEIAQRYWAGEQQDLVGARAAVWDYIQKKYPSHDELASREGRAARGLLCVFWPEQTWEEAGDNAEWFAAMIDRAGYGL
jgi:hypothetical protein